jgi:hypothetical protein
MPIYSKKDLMENKFLFVYEFQIYEIPERMRESLELYVNLGVMPGDFLQAVICNDLKKAVMYADGENMGNLPAYVNYFYNHTPHDCHGSEIIMGRWMAEKKIKKGGEK